ncbi:two pore calcium channel protein 1-like [Gigantopelta aegis]|uniref:two pore calcium channel protein 1-like n=1 Tax=Gigantopelta aegis TaxID=1735272 RepID=UPI001B88D3E3|nr:two pore calcium channel protein 1-like [Gigantopelta aegis]
MEEPVIVVVGDRTTADSSDKISTETASDTADSSDVQKNGKDKSHRIHSSPSDDPELQDEQLLLAATLVLDAKRGRNMNFKKDDKHVKSYQVYHHFFFRWSLYFFITVDLALALVENPTRKGWQWPLWATIFVELICISFFIYRIVHAAYVTETTEFWKDTKNILVISSIVLMLIDIIVFVIWTNNVEAPQRAIRWSRSLRPLFIVNFSDGKQVRRAFRNIRRTVPDIMNVLILFFLSVFLFGLLALKLFGKRQVLVYPNGHDYFKNYFDCIWDLYVLVTTANDPDVMMPAYDNSNWFALFFIGYLIICLYIFMSIVLAAIYNNYKKNLKNEIRMSVYGKRRRLASAFDILKVKRQNHYVVTHHRWCQFMKKVLPGKSMTQIELLMRVLDRDGHNCISKQDFLNLADLLNVELTEITDRQTILEKTFPRMYNSKYSKCTQRIVRHRFFRYSFDFMIFINAFFIAFDVDNADWFFLSIFTVEIILKMYTFGPKYFFIRFWNSFDFFVIGSALIASIVEVVIGASNEELRTLDILLVLRVLRLIKLFGSIQRFKVVITTIINIGPSIITYGGVIFVFYYFFAIIGIEIFHGKIHYYGYNESVVEEKNLWCGNAALKDSMFYRFHYCNNNFNDILKAFVLLFELTVVNQWHVLTSGFVMVTHKAARIYFFLFHLTCVVIVLNIFTAFILEAFILEYSLQRVPKIESQVEATIKELGLGIGGSKVRSKSVVGDTLELVDNEQLPESQDSQTDGDVSDTDSIEDFSNEKGLKFLLKKRSRKKVEVLLQQMFEGEIDPEDEGPSGRLDDLYPHDPLPRKMTLEAIT